MVSGDLAEFKGNGAGLFVKFRVGAVAGRRGVVGRQERERGALALFLGAALIAVVCNLIFEPPVTFPAAAVIGMVWGSLLVNLFFRKL